MTDISSYADILVLGLTVAAIGVLGFIIFFNDPRSATHRAFFLFSSAAVVWGVINFAAYQATTVQISLWLWRLVIFSALWFCFSIFRLAYAFPDHNWPRNFRWYIGVQWATAIVSLLTLTPLVFASIAGQLVPGQIPVIENGPLIPIFGLCVAALVIGSIVLFIRKAYRENAALKKPVAWIMGGTAITFALLILFNFILPTTLRIFSFIPFGAVFILPFVLCTAYAIGRYRLFDIRLVAAQLFSFLLVIATLIQILFSTSLFEVIFRISSFVLVLALAILFVKSVILEIKQRETIEKQEKELEAVNTQQENLLHFISHEIKGYLAKSEAGFAAIAEGDYGAVPASLHDMAAAALSDVRRGVHTVMDILDASNLKKGTVAYNKAPFDLKATVLSVADELRPGAEEKGLHLEVMFAPSGTYTINGDEEKIRHHVIRNLIDNSIKYTPSGKVTAGLSRNGDSIRFSVEDTGVGITRDDMQRLFTEGGHGKDSIKVNVHSTGYGLYIAKQIVEAHGGKIWAESDGAGKGSRFIAEFQVSNI